jgi:hypothetical protein
LHVLKNIDVCPVDKLAVNFSIDLNDNSSVSAIAADVSVLFQSKFLISKEIEESVDHVAVEFSKIFSVVKGLDNFAISVCEKESEEKIEYLMKLLDISEVPVTEPPSVVEPPPEATPQKPPRVLTEIQLRDSTKAKWVKESYNYHCQICLSRETPEILTYPKSYASIKSNRRLMIQGHHMNEIAKGEGHDHIGNILSLCRHHHNWFHTNRFDESFLSILKDSLNNVSEKEIVWPNGTSTKWKMIRCKIEFGDAQPMQIVFNDIHLNEVKKYVQFMQAEK